MLCGLSKGHNSGHSYLLSPKIGTMFCHFYKLKISMILAICILPNFGMSALAVWMVEAEQFETAMTSINPESLLCAVLDQ